MASKQPLTLSSGLSSAPACLQVGQPLVQKMLLFDGATTQFRTVKLRPRSTSCAACGEHPTITAASQAGYDYAAFTGQAPDDKGVHCQGLLDSCVTISWQQRS